VALVNKFFKCFGGSIVLIGCKIKFGIVSPRRVAVKFLYGH